MSSLYETHVIYETHIDDESYNNDINLNTMYIDFENKPHPLSNHSVPVPAQNKSNKQIMCDETLREMNG